MGIVEYPKDTACDANGTDPAMRQHATARTTTSTPNLIVKPTRLSTLATSTATTSRTKKQPKTARKHSATTLAESLPAFATYLTTKCDQHTRLRSLDLAKSRSASSLHQSHQHLAQSNHPAPRA